MADRKTILILGAGIMQLPAIRTARRMGLRVIVADGNARAPGIDEADAFEHVDLRDRESMLVTARRYFDAGDLHAVFTAGTDFSSAVAYVTEALGLPGTSLESALNATDKFRMRNVLRGAGVRVPEFTVIEASDMSAEAIRECVGRIGLPVVVKPADSMGARGVVRADSLDDVIKEARRSVSHSASGRVVIEGYIEGPEFSIDAIVYAGVVQITGFADRHIAFPPYFIEMGHTIPSAIDKSAGRHVLEEFERGVAALGITHGAAKGDMKLSPDGPVVGEIAARLSGGFMSGWTFPFSSGVELTERAIEIALGRPPGTVKPRWARTSAERAVISIPGVVSRVTGVDHARSRDAIGAIFMSTAPGAEVRLPTSNVEKCGNVIAVADDRNAAIEQAERAVAAIEVVLAPGTQSTDLFLFGEPDGYWAYSPGALPHEWRLRVGLGPEEILKGSPGLASVRGTLAQRTSDGLPVAVGTVPGDGLLKDWSWRTLNETVQTLREAGLVRTDRFDPIAAPPVWRAIIRGGLQGGRYLLASDR